MNAESRRAVLVGIDIYNPDPATRAQLQQKPVASSFPRPPAQGDALYWRIDNLDGSINDVTLMQGVLQGLGISDMVTLKNQDATADAILRALQHNLVDDAQSGDVRVFYYAGHGNHMRNAAWPGRRFRPGKRAPINRRRVDRLR
jgi:Caspase domain